MSQAQPSWSPDSSTEVLPIAMQSVLRRELWMLSRSRRLILTCLATALLLAGVYNYGSRPLYEAVSVVSMDEAGVSTLKARGSVDQSRKLAALEEQVRLLKSPELALVAVTGVDPVVAVELARGPLGDWKERIEEELRFRLGISRPHGSALPEQVAAFRSRLSVDFAPPATWVYVRFRGYDAKAAAVAVNRLMELYLVETERQTKGASIETKQFIEGKVAESKDRAEETLGKLQTFETQAGLENLQTRRDLVEKELARLQDSLITARQNRFTRRALFEESQALALNKLTTIPSVREDREVSDSLSRISDIESQIARGAATLGDRHPEIVGLHADLDLAVKRLNARLSSIRESISREYRIAEREERDLSGAIGSAQRNLSVLDRNSTEHSFIQKQAEAGQRAVGELIDKSAREASEEVFFEPKVLQRAEASPVVVSPQRSRNFQYALLIGLGLGISLAWLRSHLDETIKTPDDIKANLGLPLVGMIPNVGNADFNLFSPQEGEASRLVEAYRVLRTNLMVGDDAPKGSRLILITSSREAEGKTTTSCGMGVALARSGQRVLLIDGDLRRASLSRLLMAADHAGLGNAVEGKAVELCITRTPVPGLSLMPSGPRRPDAAEILNRERLAGIIESVRPQYDWIICDAPPVLAVADAAILCRLADSVLVVIGANSTPLGSVRATLDQLAAVGAKVRGVVLSRIDLSKDSHYYKHYYSAQYEEYVKGTKRRVVKAHTAYPSGIETPGHRGLEQPKLVRPASLKPRTGTRAGEAD